MIYYAQMFLMSNASTRFINRSRFGVYFHSWSVDDYYLFAVTQFEESSQRLMWKRIDDLFVVDKHTDMNRLIDNLMMHLWKGENANPTTAKMINDTINYNMMVDRTYVGKKPEAAFKMGIKYHVFNPVLPRGWIP